MRGQSKIVHFLDGYLQEATEKQVQAIAPGNIEGPGMFETMRTVNGEIFLLEEHLRRLSEGLKLIGLENPFSVDQWWKIIQKTMDANHLTEARVRVMVWKNGRHTESSVIARPLVLPAEPVYRKGYRLAVVDLVRPAGPLSHVKSTDYGLFIRALQLAQVRLCDDAILLNDQGHVVEASRANLFWIVRGELHTPSTATGCLAGITRQVVMQIASRQKIAVREVEAPVSAIEDADAVFVTNSIIGVMPVRRVNRCLFYLNHPLLKTLARVYAEYLEKTPDQ